MLGCWYPDMVIIGAWGITGIGMALFDDIG